MPEKKVSILILGAGAVGLSIAAKLSAYCHVSVVCRKRHKDAILKSGLLIEGVWGSEKVSDIRCFSAAEHGFSGENYDYILITAKSTDTESICEEYKDIIEGQIIVSIQNGIGNEEIIKKYSDFVIGATITTNFSVYGDGSVKVQSESEPLKAGLYPNNSFSDNTKEKAVDSLIGLMNKSGISAEKCSDIRSAIWEKTLLNIAVNPITALFSIPVGSTLDENLKFVISEIIKEAFFVIQSEKINMRWENSDEYLEYLFSYLIPSFSKVYTSMYQDIKMKRFSEIDFINGAVVNTGMKNGVKTPFNSCICSFIKYLETD